MTANHTPGFNTLAIHAGARPDAVTGSRQTPIHQTSSFVFKSAEHAATLFNLQDVGFIYSRLTNPTVSALEERIAALESMKGATCTASGHAAQMMAFFALLEPGDSIVSSQRLYGGTINQLSRVFPEKFGWNTTFVDVLDLDQTRDALAKAKRPRALFVETLDNPSGLPCDLEALAGIAHDAGVPLIVDNTSASPWLCRPAQWGADLVVASTTKFLTGNGSTIGGVVADSGQFDWRAHGFNSFAKPQPGYHGLVFGETFGELAFTIYCHAVGLRDLGASMAPHTAFLTLLGIETLPLRMERHCSNAVAVAQFLSKNSDVAETCFVGLSDHPQHALAKKYLSGGFGSVFTATLKGGLARASAFVDALNLFSHVANIGDARSLAIHPASTTHSQLDAEQLKAVGLNEAMVRFSIGLENQEDIIADLEQALAATRHLA